MAPGGFLVEPVRSPTSTVASEPPSTPGRVQSQPPIRFTVLSSSQERRLREWLEAQFIDLERSFKRRQRPGAALATLQLYIAAMRPILSVITLIPPSLFSLRVTYLLRLTSEVLDDCVEYPLAKELDPEESVKKLLEIFRELDSEWLDVLATQMYDASTNSRSGSLVPGTPTTITSTVRSPSQTPTLTASGISPNGVSQTDKIRLSSLLVNGLIQVDEWISRVPTSDHTGMNPKSPSRSKAYSGVSPEMRERVSEAFWQTMETLEEDDEEEDAWERVGPATQGESEMECRPMEMDVDMDMDEMGSKGPKYTDGLDGPDPGMFHGFDDL